MLCCAQSCLTFCNPMDYSATPLRSSKPPHQAPLSMEFSRQEYWNGLPFPPTGDFPNPEIDSRSPALQADSLPSEPPRKPIDFIYIC